MKFLSSKYWLTPATLLFALALFLYFRWPSKNLASAADTSKQLVFFGGVIAVVSVIAFAIIPIVSAAKGKAIGLPWRSQTLLLPCFGAFMMSLAVFFQNQAVSEEMGKLSHELNSGWGLNGLRMAITHVGVTASLALSFSTLYAGLLRANYIIAFRLEAGDAIEGQHPVWRLINRQGVSSSFHLKETTSRVGVVLIANSALVAAPALAKSLPEVLKSDHYPLGPTTLSLVLVPGVLALFLLIMYLTLLYWDKLVENLARNEGCTDSLEFLRNARRFHLQGCITAGLIFTATALVLFQADGPITSPQLTTILLATGAIVSLWRFGWSIQELCTHEWQRRRGAT